MNQPQTALPRERQSMGFGAALPLAASLPGVGDATSLLHGICDRLPLGLLLCDAGGRITLVNAYAERCLGLDGAGVVGMDLALLSRRSALDFSPLLGDADGRGGVLCSRRSGRTYLVDRQAFEDGTRLWVLRDAADADSEPAPAASVEAPRGDDVHARLLELGMRAHARGARVLLLGESGSGKTALAKRIHACASADAPFIHVNCGGIPETLFESELFGYVRGAFSGALNAGKRGLIESADGGTLFLDEIGELPPASQAKLLKFLDDGIVVPVGASSGRSVSVRVIAATNRELKTLSAAGQFREDLYYRLAVVTLRVPALRDSPDRAQLIDALLAEVCRGREQPLRLSPALRAWLDRYRFPGNVRELANLLEYLAVVADGVADLMHLPDELAPAARPAADPVAAFTAPAIDDDADLRTRVARYERELISATLAGAASKREAARRLGIDVATLIRKLARA
ncbi:sigma 54-interacting transcriptional regulator [Plasticicumulans acidivorans]|uniref:HTH-type transcriptional regulatory protein TyrR n=1 Tax=Plasticicumulans acidivorans TaxID=886464 RepID=A0A317MRE9_9GAMM|nr:sigma 54-interacting transcriptional regulator [Plasticicumulans acidivorans]PWV58858.1 transcriptional regulator with PAS, ATPase and Fis domain [Plasticicumulans acidivorans]